MPTKNTPNYLRLHRAPSPGEAKAAANEADSNQFWTAFSDATGWRIDQREKLGEVQQTLLPKADLEIPDGDGKDQSGLPIVKRDLAEQLAKSGQALMASLESAKEALRRQDAELAARAAIIQEPGQRQSLAVELRRVLNNAVEACGCKSAAIYTLDEDTRVLTLRTSVGLDAQTHSATRLLRGSRGDLEAMVRNVVMINDLNESSIDLWRSPEPAGAAICASVNSADVPVGTLWLFADEPKEFSASHAAAVELASREITLLLERAASGTGTTVSRDSKNALRDLTQWQLSSLPMASALAQGWAVDGMIESNRDWTVGWHNWDVLPDGTLLIAMAQAEDDSLSGAMVAATARAAMTSHTGYRHNPSQVLQRVSDTLWETNTAEQLISLMYLRFDPDTGEGEVAVAGKMNAIIGSRYGYRPLLDGRTDPLGLEIEAKIDLKSFRLGEAETLLGYGKGLAAIPNAQSLIGTQIRDCSRSGDRHVLAAIRRSLAKTPITEERGAISVTRHESR